ncbi:MAG: hypothetical protein RBR71_09815 [Gudongella sp.]|nr:hypothetical protein [Gudongella sp.]
MERISEAGVLYLNDYQILTEARKEVERFLNAIVDEVYNIIVNETDKISSDNFSTNIWQNQTAKGHLEVQLIGLKENSIFRKDKADLYIVYKDIRNIDDIEPNSGKITVWSPNVASKLEKSLGSVSMKSLGEDIYQSTIVEFDLNNSMSTAEEIAREIFNKYDLIEKLITEIL